MPSPEERERMQEDHGFFPGEAEATIAMLRTAELYGYGNLIAHLKRAWIISLMNTGLDETAAKMAADVDPYPIKTTDKIIDQCPQRQ